MLWFIVFTSLAILVVETLAAGFMVRRKHLDKWLPSYLFGMDLCPRLNRPDSATLERIAPLIEAPVVVEPEKRLAHGWRSGLVNGEVEGHQTPYEQIGRAHV